MSFQKFQKLAFLGFTYTHLTLGLYGQTPHIPSGIPFIQNFTPEQYRANFQNLDVVQAKNGLLYFANAEGILEYDGNSWRLMQTPKSAFILSLATDSTGRVFAGSFQDLGYLTHDSTSTLQFVSLLAEVDSSYRDFTSVWKTHVTPEGVFYNAGKYFFRWKNQQMQIWQAKTAFAFSFEIDNELLIIEKNKGLMRVEGDSLKIYPGGEQFAKLRVFDLLPMPGGQFLVVTLNDGLYIFDAGKIYPFAEHLKEFLSESLLTGCIQLPGGDYTFSSRKNGLLVMDAKGNLLKTLGKPDGLQDHSINGMALDNQNGLWLAMESGISRVELASPASVFDKRSGLQGKVYFSTLHQGKLFVGTSKGLFVNRAPDNSFQRIRGIDGNCWSILSKNDNLLAGADVGLFKVDINSMRATAVSQHRVRVLVAPRNSTMQVYPLFVTQELN